MPVKSFEEETASLREMLSERIGIQRDASKEPDECKLLNLLRSEANDVIDSFRNASNPRLSNTKMKVILKATALNIKTMEMADDPGALRRSLKKNPESRAKLNDVKGMRTKRGQKNWIKWALIHISSRR